MMSDHTQNPLVMHSWLEEVLGAQGTWKELFLVIFGLLVKSSHQLCCGMKTPASFSFFLFLQKINRTYLTNVSWHFLTTVVQYKRELGKSKMFTSELNQYQNFSSRLIPSSGTLVCILNLYICQQKSSLCTLMG